METEVQKKQIKVKKSSLRWLYMGTPTGGCDMIPPLRSGIQTLHKKTKKSRREAKRRRDGRPGPSSGRGPEDKDRPGHQGGAGGQGAAGRARGHSGAGKAGGTEDPHGGADKHHSKLDMTKDPRWWS